MTRRRVETGRRQDDRVEITGDYPVDAEIVHSGSAFLSDGATVRVSTDGAQAAVEVTENTEDAQ